MLDRVSQSRTVLGDCGCVGMVHNDASSELDLTVVVVGLGYVGLPLAALAACNGLPVVGVDIDRDRVAGLARDMAISVSVEPRAPAWLERTSPSALPLFFFRFSKPVDYPSHVTYVVTVDTPLTADKPDLKNLLEAASWVGGVIQEQDLVIVESTVAPGTTRNQIAQTIEANSGMSAGRDFSLAFSPERVDPGNEKWSLTNTPKLVAGIDDSSLLAARSFYQSLGVPVVEVPSVEAAEMAKLLENSFRALNIAFANEIQSSCVTIGIDWRDVFTAASSKPFGFMSFHPSPGVGGHCIPVDAVYLADALRTANGGRGAPLLELAIHLNKARANEVAEVVLEYLRGKKKDPSECDILIIGLGYKSGSRDLRNSPAIDIARALERAGVRVHGHDPIADPTQWAWPMVSFNKIKSQGFDLIVDVGSANSELVEKLTQQGLDVFNPLATD